MSGWFGLLGSGEFQPWSGEVDEWVLSRVTGDGRVLVLPTASAPEGDEVFSRWIAGDRGEVRGERRREVGAFSRRSEPAEFVAQPAEICGEAREHRPRRSIGYFF